MTMKKYILYILLLIIPAVSSFSAYWKQFENLLQPYKSNYWLDVYFLPSNPQYGWICGFNGLVLRTTDAGNSWAGSQVPGANHLESIHFPTIGTGYTSGIDGVFKSTDGGASWADVSDSAMSFKVWGCYFVTANDGMAVGGGCGDSTQYFWRTTDGGTSWTTYIGNEPNSGLTDAIIYQPNGLGYAVSSGKIWITNNGGSSWSVFANTELSNETNRWQEEITKMGSSFLLPYSGWQCAGGGNEGGMLFTTNNGASWNRAATGDQMFGTFLISETSGWACGYNGAIYYTSNTGISWVKKNCGVKEGNLDDIWFVNPTTGWVVGQGIYKFVPDTCKFNSDSLIFELTCYPATNLDTTYLVNHSFDDASALLNISGPSANEFTLISPKPNQLININPCDSLEVIVSMVPLREGLKLAYLNANINNSYMAISNLYALSAKSTAAPDNYTLIIDTAFCNTNTSKNMLWTAQFEGEYIDTIKKQNYNPDIKTNLNTRLKIWSFSTPVSFVANPKDTGWAEEIFEVQLSPCGRDTTIKVRAYGVSPIITARDTSINVQCYSELTERISLPIYNSGNFDLKIENITNSNSKVKLVGFKSTNTLQANIRPKKLDTLILEFVPKDIINNELVTLSITNNDSTKVRGNKNPFLLNINVINNYSILTANKKIFLADTICYTDSSAVQFTITNSSISVGKYDVTTKTVNCSYKLTPLLSNKVVFNANEIKILDFILYPIAEGDYSLEMNFYNEKCNDSLKINISGSAVKNEYDFSITEINRIVQTDTTSNIDLLIKSLSNGGAMLDTAFLKNETADLKFEYSPMETYIPPMKELNMKFKITTDKDKTFIDTIVVVLDGYCDNIYLIPVKIVSVSSKLELSDYQLRFDSVLCKIYEQSKSFNIKNTGSAEDIITDIQLDDITNFSIVYPSPLPITVEKNTQEVFLIKYHPIDTGFTKTKIRIFTEKMKEEYFEIEVIGFYGYSNSKLSITNKDFGKFQFCDNTYKFMFNIENTGNIADTIELLRENPISGVSINNHVIIIQAQQKADYEISISPKDIELFGDISEELIFTCSPCSGTLMFNYNMYMINMSASANPILINFNDLWIDKPVTKQITFTNNSNDILIIDSIKLSLANPDLVLSDVPANGYKLPPLGFINFNLTCTPTLIGNIDNSIKIDFKIHCPDSIIIPLSGYVPDEVYFVNFHIDQYIHSPNDIFTISLILDSVLADIPVDSVEITLDYDLYLLDFSKVTYKGKTINFKNENDLFSATIAVPLSNDFLKTEGSILDIEALSLLSLPDTTSICIKEIKVYSKKKIISTYQDGFYRLTNYCLPEAEMNKFKYQNLNIELDSKLITNNFTTLRYNSDIESPLDIHIYNYTGEIVARHKIYIKGIGQYELNLNDLSSGVYYINCSRWGKSYLNSEILIFK